jgi:ribosome-associated toxin RatA of RatAB toxin-antitoxin module
MMFEIDLGDIGIYDAKVKASFEHVRGCDEVTLESVEINLPIAFEGRNKICVNVSSLLSDRVKLDLVDAFLLRYHDQK